MSISIKDIFTTIYNGDITFTEKGFEIRNKDNHINIDENGITSSINGNKCKMDENGVNVNGKIYNKKNPISINNKRKDVTDEEWSPFSFSVGIKTETIKLNNGCVYKNIYKNDKLISTETHNCSKTYEEYMKCQENFDKNNNSWFW